MTGHFYHNTMLGRLTMLLVMLATVSTYVSATKKARPVLAITHYNSNDFNIPESFLEEAKKNGYKYVIGQGSLSDTNVTDKNDWGGDNPNGIYNPVSGDGKLYNSLYREFVAAAKFDLKLIPFFNLGNRHSGHWEVTNNTTDWNKVLEYEYEYSDTEGNDNLGGVSFIESLSVDVNNDGITEVVQLWDNSGRLGLEVYSISSGSYQLSWSNTWTNLDLGGVDAIKYFTADVNNDGRTDILKLWDTKGQLGPDKGQLGLEVYTSDGSGYQLSWSNTWTDLELGGVGYKEFLTADVNGDGRTDVLHLWDNNGRLGLEVYTSDGSGYHLSWSNTWTNLDLGGVDAIKYLTADVNNDGRTDILQLWDTKGQLGPDKGQLGLEVYASDGSGYQLSWSNTWTDLELGGVGYKEFLTADVNGDGRTDVLHLWNNNNRLAIEIYTSDGAGYHLAWSNTWEGFNLGGEGAIKFLTADVNEDAHTDLLRLWDNGGKLGFEIFLAGDTSYTLSWGNDNYGRGGTQAVPRFLDMLVGDINSDGKTDLLQLWRNNGNLGLDVHTPKEKNKGKLVVPPYAECMPRPCDIDQSFKSYLEVVRRAYTDAKTNNPHLKLGDRLDYIHLGHDENATAGSNEFLIATSSTMDQEYIKKNGDDEKAYYKLIADEIVRRVNAVNKTFGGKTKTLIYADAFDPEHNGMRDVYGWTEHGGPRSIILHTKEVLTQEALTSVKDDLILVPWQYRTKLKTNELYEEKNTLAYFKSNGFKSIVGTAYEEWATDGQGMTDGRDMLEKWVDTATMSFEEDVIGFIAHNWSDDGRYWNTIPTPERFLVLPELAKKVGFFPLNDLVTFNVNQDISVTVDKYVLERTIGIIGDPFVVVNIDGVGEQHSATAEDIREGSIVVPRPNVFSRSVDPAAINNSVVPVVLKMRDDDGFIRGPSGADKLIDINPKGGRSESDLVILFNTKTNAVVPQSPQRGDDSRSRAKIFYQIRSRRSGDFTPQPSGCPSDFVGKYHFDTTLTNKSNKHFKDVKVNVNTLTGGNVLLVGGEYVIEQEGFDVYSIDGELLKPTDSETIPFTVCLQRLKPFELYVDVVGKVVPWH